MYFGKAQMNGEGYAPFLMGNVVDMLHFNKTITWNGRVIELFPPVFNVADSAITLGIILILLFQKRFFAKQEEVITEVSSVSVPAAETTVTIRDGVEPQS
jgi:signal peptidase II